MAQVLLLNPTYRGRALNFSMPSGLLCVAAVLKEKGHKIQIADFQVHQYSPAQALSAIAGMNFDIIGIGGISTAYYFWKEFVPLFRQKYGDSVPIMAGGSVASTMSETFLEFIDVDAICTGDAEPVVAELTESLLHRQSLESLGGVGYRQDKEFIVKPGLRVKDMDAEVPIPPYNLIDIDAYKRVLSPNTTRWNYIKEHIKGKTLLDFQLFSSRGCPFNCFFCSRNFGRQFVQHSVDKFIEHIVFVADNYSPDLFYFGDELMTTRRDWVIEFCAKYKATGLEIPYRINSRVDTVDMEMLVLLKGSGCYEVDLGIESGSPLILKEMNKGVTAEQNRKAIGWCNEVGLYPSPTIVFGMPSETTATMEETKAFLIEADVRTFGGFFATAYPASALFELAISKGLIQSIDEYMLNVDNADKMVINYTALSNRHLQRKKTEVARDVRYAWHKKRRMWWNMLELKLGFWLYYIKSGVGIFLKEGPVTLVSKAVTEIKSYKG